MAQGRKKTLRQGMPPCKPKQNCRSPVPSYSYNIKREIFLDLEQWQNIAETKRPWYEYNHSSGAREKAATVQSMIIPCIRDIIASCLTTKQKKIVMMYFLSDDTQVTIARKLGISQPTVSQHLNGKKRNGKKTGGSIRKIRKMIRRISATNHSKHTEIHILNLLDQLLNETTSLRKCHDLIQLMIK